MEWPELELTWKDQILHDYFWAICSSFAHHDRAYQAALYLDVWCKLSWGNYHYDTAGLMDLGFWLVDAKAARLGLTRRWRNRKGNSPPMKMARRRLRFFLKHARKTAHSMV